MLLKDRVAVVTGPAKGMGAACTRLLAEHGADLALVGRDTRAIEEVQAECRAMGRRAEIFFCDLMDPASVDTMATSVLKRMSMIMCSGQLATPSVSIRL